MNAGRRPEPPRAAEWLVRHASPRAERDFVLGDFREEFDRRAIELGEAPARSWYRREAIRSLAPLARRRLVSTRERHDSAAVDSRWSQTVDDVRYALRLSRRSPLASLAIVATITLGIASTTAVFSATNAILLRPLPFIGSDRVVALSAWVHGDQEIGGLSYPDLMDFRNGVRGFESLSVFQLNEVTLQHGTDPQLLQSLQVDDAYAGVFGLHAALGRLLVPSDSVLHAPKVAVLSYDFWMREFGGDRSLVGKTIPLDNVPVQVVGVLAPDTYLFPRASIDLLVPLAIPPSSFMHNRGAMWASAAAKLTPTASFAQTQRDLGAVATRISREFPNSNQLISARFKPLREAVVGSVQSMLELLAAAVAAVMLIACLNIANLLLGRAHTRSREFAVRSALGGTPSRVRRQVLTESLFLGSFGGIAGLLLAPMLTRALIAVYPDALPRAEEIGVNVPVIVVALAATLAAGMLSAIPTARRVARLDLADDLRDGGRSGGSRRDRRAGRALVVTQVAASLALLFAANLLLQTFWRLTKVRPGFEPRHAVAFHVFPTNARYKGAPDVARYYDDVIRALRAVPGVQAVSSVTYLPFSNRGGYDVFVQEERGDQGPSNPVTAISVNSPDFEHALGIPVVRGRAFTPQDDSTGEHVVLINEVVARRFYPGQDPVGRFIQWNGQPHWRIVGVMGATHLRSLDDELMPVLYAPAAQALRRSRYLVVRSDATSDQVIAAARNALRRIDPTIALTDIATMDQRIARSLGAQRFRAALMAMLGALALVLAVIGIYSVVAYSVSRRTREIGVRMALGEASHEVRRRVMVDALRVASAGLVIGVALALASGKWLTSFLIGVSPYDGAALAATIGLLVTVVAAAAYGPARRAARVDPVSALRAD